MRLTPLTTSTVDHEEEQRAGHPGQVERTGDRDQRRRRPAGPTRRDERRQVEAVVGHAEAERAGERPEHARASGEYADQGPGEDRDPTEVGDRRGLGFERHRAGRRCRSAGRPR